ncbi:hypothetical protein QVD99_008157 [Batrachochytrium dendrobatidis]|nr:hypothetical protein O5D80_004690 [Batrachochytrium dendrobatidis]KAK5665325.1 hypothetical protein QVD99_008157 [Batrachochytrium dendrobatidis]
MAASDDIIEIVLDCIDHCVLMQRMRDDGAGALSSFLGTTRNTFTDATGVTRQVQMLSYEAYIPMAVKQMQSIAAKTRAMYTSIMHIAIVHRVGQVPVGQASIVVIASSPHRRDAIEAVAWIMDEVKATVPIWKMEIYTDGSMWKENAEWQQKQLLKRGSAHSCCHGTRHITQSLDGQPVIEPIVPVVTSLDV